MDGLLKSHMLGPRLELSPHEFTISLKPQLESVRVGFAADKTGMRVRQLFHAVNSPLVPRSRKLIQRARDSIPAEG